MQREHHYFEDIDTHEYWECPHHSSDWYIVDASVAGDWNGESYRYIRWSTRPSLRSDKYPPRGQYQ